MLLNLAGPGFSGLPHFASGNFPNTLLNTIATAQRRRVPEYTLLMELTQVPVRGVFSRQHGQSPAGKF